MKQSMPFQGHASPLLQVADLKVHFPIRGGLFSRVKGHVYAVDGVSLSIGKGETLALVGESGCGKSTAGRAITKLIEPTAGTINFDGLNITSLSRSEMHPMRRRIQFVFQDPYASLTPQLSAGELIGEPLWNFGERNQKIRDERVSYLLERVGLRPSDAKKYPHEFSGGQRQRIGIARALAVMPDLIVCDEPVSALDVSVQAQVLNLLVGLQEEFNIAYLFISHDLAVVEHISHRVAVMYLGKIVELGTTDEVFDAPRHPYTQALLSAVPVANIKPREVARIRLTGDVPNPSNPPSGCSFRTRCLYATEKCMVDEPVLVEDDPGHFSACHHRLPPVR